MEPYPTVANPGADKPTNLCVACGTPFAPVGRNHKLCKRGCGRARSLASRNGVRADRRERHLVDFVSVDGEGVDRPDGKHEYIMLSVGEQSLVKGGERLTTKEIFDFLWECFQENRSAAYVGYFLGYDFTMWFQDLPEKRARMLLTPEGMAARRAKTTARMRNPKPFPVRWGPWEFDIMPGFQRFQLRYGDSGPWLYVCDSGPMFQTSFLTSINPADWSEPICSPEEFEVIKQGKESRGVVAEYGDPIDPDMRRYNVAENRLMAKLMDRQNRGLVDMGVKLRRTQWFGPGQAAQAWLKLEAPAHNRESCAGAVEREALLAARSSYFGGWFEIMAHGPVPGETYEYDINSAYPSIIAELPCLLHGTWTHGTGRPTGRRPYRLVRADVSGGDYYVGAMPHRRPDGTVLRPGATAGWYWQHELESARRAGLVGTVKVREHWTYEPCDCAPPFRAIRELYQLRLKAGKKSPLGKAAKLVYNSTYGKMAQSIGSPQYGNPIYASLITAGCRSMITDAIATHPQGSEAVVMVATDGVYFTSPHPTLDIDPGRLGAWDEGVKENLCLFKPGVYWDDKARAAVRAGAQKLGLKSRGVNERALAQQIERIDAQWLSFNRDAMHLRESWPAIKLTVPFSMTSTKQALARDKWETAGLVEHDKQVEQSAWPLNKRQPRDPYHLRRLATNEGYAPFIRTAVHHREDPYESSGYDKSFGLDLEGKFLEGQFITPEGDYGMLLDQVLGGLQF